MALKFFKFLYCVCMYMVCMFACACDVCVHCVCMNVCVGMHMPLWCMEVGQRTPSTGLGDHNPVQACTAGPGTPSHLPITL